uniref:ADP-ribose pyrophosphatase, mitochondrial n=1 Tax=Ciona intestinalis TaxID=7719 RepID=F7AUJ8_CIOIN
MTLNSASKLHVKARTAEYPLSACKRFCVSDDKVDWKVEFKEYSPVSYTAPSVERNPPWADVDVTKTSKTLKYNEIDGKVNRKSYTGVYKVSGNLPINPMGRTGVVCRGLLGKWGPNHAADPIVTRWKRDGQKRLIQHKKTQKPILQFVAIQRKDNKQWAIPGGMVDADEKVSVTLKREFSEETLNSLDANAEEKRKIYDQIKKLFKHGTVVYKGYVDDPRNTDNAWMETVAVNFHDDNGESVGRLPLSAGDDAGAVAWIDVGRELTLYASHEELIKKTSEIHSAHW